MACSIHKNSVSLSYGALNEIQNGNHVQDAVLQILGYKEIPGSQNARFRLLLNDGVMLFSYAILTTSLNHFVFDKNLEKYTIFKLKSYACNELEANKKVIICVDIEILVAGSEVNTKIEKDNFSCLVCNKTASVSNFAKVNNQPSIEPGTSSAVDIPQNWDTATTAESTNSKICSIAHISPYSKKWIIKACVYYKTPLNSFNKPSGQGKVFSFFLSDNTGQIKATAFNDVAERMFESIELFKTYLVSNATVKTAKENISFNGDFELIIEDKAKIELCGDIITPLSSIFKFRTIEEILSLPKESYTDVIGICMHVYDISTVVTKLNKEVVKRSVIIFDRSKKSILVTLWNSQAQNFKACVNEVIVIKNAKITSFHKCSLSTESASMIYVNPPIEETESLKSWFNSLRPAVSSQLSPSTLNHRASEIWKTLSEIISNNDNNTKWPIYYKTKAIILMVKNNNCLYQACPVIGCSKKVHDLKNGLYKCSKCSIDFNTFCWKLFLPIEIGDFTRSLWTVAFQDTAENLIGMSSEELSKIRDEDEEKYIDVLSDLNLKSYIFELRSQFEAFGEDVQLRTSILNFHPINLPVYTKKLLSDIGKFSKILSKS